MNLNFLPFRILDCVKRLNIDKLYEIRLRVGYSVVIKYESVYCYLAKDGITSLEENGIKCLLSEIESIILNLTERSIYAYNDKIKKGFLTTMDGIRIGLAGECVFDKEIITFKNIRSLNIRVPHEIIDCSNAFFNYIFDGDNIYNSLIISPPFCGKTTILKDLARKLNYSCNYNILIIDERGEFEKIKGGWIDSIKYSNKIFAFENGLRSLSPDIVITDELSDINDWKYVKRASNSGVKIIASCHGACVEDIVNKEFFENKIFQRYLIIDNDKSHPGILKKVYDEDFNIIL